METFFNFAPSTLIYSKHMNDNLMTNPFYAKAMDYIRSHDLTVMENGKHIIDGDNLWVTIMDCEMRKPEESRLEVHNDYIDIQIPLSTSEDFGIRMRGTCSQPDGEFDTEKDILFFNDAFEKMVTVEIGNAITFSPEDAHAPLIGEGTIHKVSRIARVLLLLDRPDRF